LPAAKEVAWEQQELAENAAAMALLGFALADMPQPLPR
jgi:hypothetical protein